MLWNCVGYGQTQKRAEESQAAMSSSTEIRIDQEQPVEQEKSGIDAQASEKLSEQEQEELNDDIELICETLASIAGQLKTRAMLTQVQTFLDNLSPADDEDDDNTRDDGNASGDNEVGPGLEGTGGENGNQDNTNRGDALSTESFDISDDEWPEALSQLSAEDWQDEANKAGMELQAFKRLVMKEHKMQSSNR